MSTYLSIFEKARSNYYFKKYPSIWQFIKFSLVGVLNTLVDFGVYTLLTRLFFLHFLIANFFSFSLAVTCSFILNRIWTFKNNIRKIHSQYLKFLFVSVIGLLGNELILYLLVKHLYFYDLWAKVLATTVILFWNFIANKYWTFKILDMNHES